MSVSPALVLLCEDDARDGRHRQAGAHADGEWVACADWRLGMSGSRQAGLGGAGKAGRDYRFAEV
jgi:CTP:molybdopterin cytidylyltransferase MocA